MEWLVYILLGLVIIQMILLGILFRAHGINVEMIGELYVKNYLLNQKIRFLWPIDYDFRVDNTPSNEEGNGSINPSEADTGLCHEVSRQK